MSYTDRTQINVSGHIEKKGRFSYLSWVYALDELQKQDEAATWDYHEHIVYPDGSMMVYTSVKAFGKTLDMMLPVMDHNNKAIKNPDAFAINKAYMRCLAKNVAVHGIGLYIFAGEDIPNAEDTPDQSQREQTSSNAQGVSGTRDTITVKKISDAQFKRLFAICKEANVDVKWIMQHFGYNDGSDIPMSQYDKVCEWAEVGHKVAMVDDVFNGDSDQ